MTVDGTTTNTVEYDTKENRVDAVTVFQADRAEVRRRIKVELKDGQNNVEIMNLPTCLQEDSIRVDGIGNATIFDVIYHPPLPYDQKQNAESLVDLNSREAQVHAELKILNRQAEVLSDYSRTFKAGDSDSSSLEAFLDLYADRQRKIDQAVAKLKEELNGITKEFLDWRNALPIDTEGARKRGTRITVIVLADGPGLAELSLTYVVKNAWWMPHYDLRASIANDSKSQSKVSLHYRASISQKTGEDWGGVQLTLSTASLLLGTEVPKLAPYWIGPQPSYERALGHAYERTSRSPPMMVIVPEPIRVPPSNTPTDDRRTRRGSRSSRSWSPPPPPMQQQTAVPMDSFASVPEPPGFFRGMESNAAEGAVSTTFGIPGLSTIPSDSDKEKQTHKVTIAELQFDLVELEWITVPKDTSSVFLRCKVKNNSKFVLLSGQANIFLNGSFVAKSSFPHVSQQESFSCSLGVDPAVRATYHPQTKKIRSTGGSIIGTKTKVTYYKQKITIKNTRLSQLPRLIVKDQIFVSRDARFKVRLLEPRSLSGPQKEGTVNRSVTVRWSSWKAGDNNESTADVDMESAQGMLEWNCKIDPGATVDLSLAWEVSAPAGVEWIKQ